MNEMTAKKVLLLEDSPKLGPLYALNLDLYVGAEVHLAKAGKSALEELQFSTSYDLIITRATVRGEYTAFAIYDYLRSRSIHIPQIVLGQEPLIKSDAIQLSERPTIRDLVRTSAKILNVTAKDMAQKKVPSLYPVPLDLLDVLDVSPWDFFKKRKDCEELEIVIKQGIPVTRQILDSLQMEGETSLYIDQQERLKFVNLVSEKLLKVVRDEDSEISEKMVGIEKGLAIISSDMREYGMSETTITLAQESVKTVVDIASRSPQLRNLLDILLIDDLGFRYTHSQVMVFMCIHVLKTLGWDRTDELEKLSFASFFHDIVLLDDKQSEISTMSELKNSNYSEREKETILKHAALAANMIKKCPDIPKGTDIIIRQHHGSLKGVGLSEFATSLSPLSLIFLVSEEFVHILLNAKERGKKLSKQKVFTYLRDKYELAFCQKIIKTFEFLKI